MSGSQTSLASTPSSSAKNRLPYVNWRTIASPPGRFESHSTHMPLTGAQLPAAMASLMRRKTSG